MDKQKVLIVHNYYKIPGGEDSVVKNELKLLKDNGHSVFFYSRNNSEIDSMSFFRRLLLPFGFIFNLKTYKDIRAIILKEGIDIIHVHNTLSLISPAVYYAADKCGVPVVQTVHNFRLVCPGATLFRDGHICEECIAGGLGVSVTHKCYRNSVLQTLICAVSTWIHRMLGIYGRLYYICLTGFNKKKLLEANISGKKIFDPDRMYIKPNFVDLKYDAPKKGSAYIYIGRLDLQKGLKVLLDAWKIMGDKAPELFIYGKGPLEKECINYIKDNRINALYKGFVSNADAVHIIGGARAVILPTLWYEGYPMTIAEAIGLGTPVISSDIGNAGALIEEGVTGLKFQAGLPQSLVSAVKRMEENPFTVPESIRKSNSPDSNYVMLKEIYDEVCNNAKK